MNMNYNKIHLQIQTGTAISLYIYIHTSYALHLYRPRMKHTFVTKKDPINLQYLIIRHLLD